MEVLQRQSKELPAPKVTHPPTPELEYVTHTHLRTLVGVRSVRSYVQPHACVGIRWGPYLTPHRVPCLEVFQSNTYELHTTYNYKRSAAAEG